MEMVQYHHETDQHQILWILVIVTGECLLSQLQPDNQDDKYAVCVKEENKIGGHVPLERPGKPGKITFYFLRSNELSSIKVIIAGKPVKLGDGDGIQVSTELVFSEVEKCIDINKTNKS